VNLVFINIYCYLCDKVNLDFHIHWIIKLTDFIAFNDTSVTSSLLCFRAILFIGFNVDATFCYSCITLPKPAL
jgi:hypothetical protein